MFKTSMKNGLLAIAAFMSLICFSTGAFAHAEGPSMDDFGLDASLEVLRRTIELQPLISVDDEKPLIVPTMKIGGKKIYLNSHFFELVKMNVRNYYEELERDLPGCQVAPLGQIITEVDEVAGSGLLGKKVLEPLGTAVSHIGISAADIGGRLGDTALIAKAAAEVGEGVLSKVVGGGGVHVFCSVIDAVIVFETRRLQTTVRNFGYSARMETSVARSFWYQAFVANAVKRAQSRVSFEFEPFEVDEHELEEVDEEGPKRFWGFIKDGRRARWVKSVADKAAKTNKDLGPNELSKIAQVGYKDFHGKRYKRFLWLKGRRWGKATNLAGDNGIEKALKNPVLWILSVQEGILNRSLLKSQNDLLQNLELLNKAETGLPDYAADDVREGLADEYGDGDPELAANMNRLLMDIERVFDPSLSKPVRYMQTMMIESVLTGFIYKLLEQQMPAMYVRDSWWGNRMWTAFKIHWYASRYAYYSHQLADYLRIAAIQTDEAKLMEHKYQAMEVMVRIFRHLQVVMPKPGQKTQDWLEATSVANKNLKKMHPWKEKRSQYSWLPFVPWRESFGNWSFLPEAENLWGFIPKLPSRAPLCVDMDKQRRAL